MTPSQKTVIICDLQPDVVNKLEKPRLFCDLVNLVVSAIRQKPQSTRLVFTQLVFPQGDYSSIPPTHSRLKVLRKLPKAQFFTNPELCLSVDDEKDTVITRTTFLPHASQEWNELFPQPETHRVLVLGYGPTVQAVCNILGDVVAVSDLQILRECVADENAHRSQSLLDHGLLFQETVTNMVDFLESLDLLHESIVPQPLTSCAPPPNKYVCDVGRGGHLLLLMPYLKQKYGYVEWPIQPWYQEQTSIGHNKQFYCPLGRQVLPLCDEPQFSSHTRFFLMGRQFLDEKDLLFQIVPELFPPTFDDLEKAKVYNDKQSEGTSGLWFLKKVNQNGGRAVIVLNRLDDLGPLEKDDQLQAHVPRPLLWEGGIKCHVKTYYYLSTCQIGDGQVEWQLYLHDCFFLATAERPWSTSDVSDECQITTLRTHRLYADHPWRRQWNLSQLCPQHLQTIVARAIEQGKLTVPASQINNTQTNTKFRTMQFEINSADWMLDEEGRIFLIECNGIPVLYDGGGAQPLCTRGLHLYDRLYKENPEEAVVNDHDLLVDAVSLAMKGKVPSKSLWKHVASWPVMESE